MLVNQMNARAIRQPGQLGPRYLQRSEVGVGSNGIIPMATITRDADPLTLANNQIPSHLYWYGLPPLFPECTGEDITTLFYHDSEPFLNWLGMKKATQRVVKRGFINWVLPVGATEGTVSSGLPVTLCDPGQGFSYDTCDYTLSDFGYIQRSGETWIVGGNQINYCETSPKWRVDGTEISDPLDWETSNLINVVMNDLAVRVLIGNKSTALDADGLLSLIKTGYEDSNGNLCPLMDSFIIDWNENPACGDPGETPPPVPTVNGVDYNGVINIVKVLRDVIRRIRRRGTLAKLPPLQAGDMILALPDWAIECIVMCAVCWIECSGDWVRMDSNNAIARREEFMGGGLGYGHLNLDGFMLPLVPYNPINYNGDSGDNPAGYLDNGDGTFNMLLLTRAFGNRDVMYMEYNDLSDGRDVGYRYATNENGQFLSWVNVDNRCWKFNMASEWRLRLEAPWAQVLFQNVSCATGVFNSDVMPFTEFA